MDRRTATVILYFLSATLWSAHGIHFSPDRVSADARNSPCRVSDHYNLTKAFIGHQRARDGQAFPDGSQATFHCEPLGSAKGDPVHMNCEKGTWVRNDTNSTLSKILCSPASEGDMILHVHGDFVVGPAAVVFVKPRTIVNLTCEFQTTSWKWNRKTTWKLRSYATSNPGVQAVRIIKGSRVAVSLNDSEVVECQCRVPGMERKITIQAGDHHFCTEPVLHPGLRVLRRDGAIIEFTCSESMEPYGNVMTIKCLKSGQWNHPPPRCVAVQTTTASTTPSKAVTNKGTCPVYSFHERTRAGVVIHADQADVPEGSVFEAGCDNRELVLVGDTGLVTCQKGGTWSFASNLQCLRGCHNFAVSDESLTIRGMKSTYRMGESVTFSCPKGKRLEPTVERMMCMEDAWVPKTVPKCVAEEVKSQNETLTRRAKGTRMRG